jgi:lipoprotein NlpD
MFIKLLILSLILGLISCAKVDKTPKNNPSKTKVVTNNTGIDCDQRYRITKGDTLFALAWKCETNVKILAKINNIKAPFTLRIGQILILRDHSKKYRKVQTKIRKKTNNSNYANTKIFNAKKKQRLLKTRPIPNFKARTSSKVTNKFKNGKTWLRPVNAGVLTSFAKNQYKGIEFSTRNGQKVLAVADGIVVYSGNKLMSYGNMIIIKHKDDYYTAYTRNQALKILEGKQVKRGQVIAKTGKKPFYFEMRRFTDYINFMNVINKPYAKLIEPNDYTHQRLAFADEKYHIKLNDEMLIVKLILLQPSEDDNENDEFQETSHNFASNELKQKKLNIVNVKETPKPKKIASTKKILKVAKVKKILKPKKIVSTKKILKVAKVKKILKPKKIASTKKTLKVAKVKKILKQKKIASIKKTLKVAEVKKTLNQKKTKISPLMMRALIETTDYQMTWTNPVVAKIATPFSSYHRFVEYNTNKNDNIMSIASGVVTFIGNSKQYGSTIVVKHQNGFVGAYINVNDYFVALGDKVETGSVIGTTNNKKFKFKFNHYTELLNFGKIKTNIDMVAALPNIKRAYMVFQAHQQKINEERIAQQQQYEQQLLQAKLNSEQLSNDEQKLTKNIEATNQNHKIANVLETTKYQLTWVKPVDAEISTPFSSYHRSVKYKTQKGDNIKAIAKGIVRFVGSSQYGQLISIEHKEGFVGAYLNIGTFKVKNGDEVKAGSIIATASNENFNFKLRHYTDFVSFSKLNSQINLVKKIPTEERIRIVKQSQLRKELQKKITQSQLERKTKLAQIAKLKRQEALKIAKIAKAYKIAQQKKINKEKKIDVEESQYTWVNPIDVPILKPFSSYHRSIEYKTNSGEAIKSIAKGVVTYVGYNNKFGQSISIMHNDGYTGAYTQMGEIKVAIGDNVKAGTIIGTASEQAFDFKLRHYTDFVNFIHLKNRAQVAMINNDLH